jgi:hypothetical protein
MVGTARSTFETRLVNAKARLCPPYGAIRPSSALRTPHRGIYAGPVVGSRDHTLKHTLRLIAAIVIFAGLAIIVAGCSDARLAANNAASNTGQPRQQSYQTSYGLTSDGPTTDLYTELKGSLQPPARPQSTAAVQAGPSAAGNNPQGPSAAVNGQPAANAGPGAVQQPAAAPREQPTTTAYGISSDGPTTDLYTELFGPRSR